MSLDHPVNGPVPEASVVIKQREEGGKTRIGEMIQQTSMERSLRSIPKFMHPADPALAFDQALSKPFLVVE